MIKLIITTDDPRTVNETKRFLKSLVRTKDDKSGCAWIEYEHIIIPRISTDDKNCYSSDKRDCMYLASLNGGKFSIKYIEGFNIEKGEILIK